MKKITRAIYDDLKKGVESGKVTILYGARQVGKTTLAREILAEYGDRGKYFNCELLSVRQNLSIAEAERLRSYIGDYDFVVFDEAQKIENIGLILKILHDTYPELRIIATGSSSFDLARGVREPLTGRHNTFTLFPFSVEEIIGASDPEGLYANLEKILRFGTYPEVYGLSDDEAMMKLEALASDYLYKDILQFEGIKKSDMLSKLLQLLALQLGNEVSYEELARTLGVSRLTVQKYVDILEQAFIIFRIGSFSRNLRKELSKSNKIYFYDLGIRNAIIGNFNPLDLRTDVGAIWENFCILERWKKNIAKRITRKRYFWRTYDQKEIDYIEDYAGILHAFECKWNSKTIAKMPKEFIETYPGSTFTGVNPKNFLDFVL